MPYPDSFSRQKNRLRKPEIQRNTGSSAAVCVVGLAVAISEGLLFLFVLRGKSRPELSMIAKAPSMIMCPTITVGRCTLQVHTVLPVEYYVDSVSPWASIEEPSTVL